MEVKGNTTQEIVNEIESIIAASKDENLTYLGIVESLLAVEKSRPYDPMNAQKNMHRNQILVKLYECFSEGVDIVEKQINLKNREDELIRISPSVKILFDGNKNVTSSSDKFLVTQNKS
jgi:hypothetical protein